MFSHIISSIRKRHGTERVADCETVRERLSPAESSLGGSSCEVPPGVDAANM